MMNAPYIKKDKKAEIVLAAILDNPDSTKQELLNITGLTRSQWRSGWQALRRKASQLGAVITPVRLDDGRFVYRVMTEKSKNMVTATQREANYNLTRVENAIESHFRNNPELDLFERTAIIIDAERLLTSLSEADVTLTDMRETYLAAEVS